MNSGQLVGRESEMDRVRAFLNSAKTDGGTLLVTGEPGVGKTGILNAASDAASALGMRILRASGVEFEAGTSFSGLNQVLLPLLSALPQLPSVHRNALNVALGFGEGTPPSRLVVSNAALELLRQAATSQPVLVILDDLHWLDRASAGVLSFVARRLTGSRAGFVGASRTGEVDFFDHAGLPTLEVQRLDDSAAGRLLDSRFPQLAPGVRERILVEAQGNPLALLELPIALTPLMRASTRALPSALPLSRRLHTLFGPRITELPPQSRHLLLLMALDGTGDLRILEGGTSKVGFHDLAAAEQVRLAYQDQDTHRLAFRHPLIRSAVVDLSHAEERQSAHRALADVWADQPDRRAWHLAEASVAPNESVAAQLEATAARILARGDAVGCVKALTRASELSPRSAERHRRLAAAAYVGAEVTGELSNASKVLMDLRRGEVPVEGSLEAAVAASSFLLNADGDVATAHSVLVGAIESREGVLDASDPVLAEALHSLLMVCTYGWDEDLWRPFDDAMARTERVPLVLHLNSKTFADPVRATPAVIAALESMIGALDDESDPKQIIRIGTAATYVDRLGGCREALWRVVRDARSGGAVASGVIAMIQLANESLQTGHWDEAEQLLREADGVCQSHGYQNMRWPSRFLLVVLAAMRGNETSVRQLSDDLVQWAGPRGIRVAHSRVAQARGLLALGRGDFEDAYQQAIKISPPGILASHVPHALTVLMDLVEAAVRTGRDSEAAAHVAVMRQANLAQLSPRLALVVGASTAIAAPDDKAAELFEEALSLHGIERWQFEAARVRLLYGEHLRRRRAMREARAQLDAARDAFERLGAQPWVDRASTEIRATGQTKPRSGESAVDRLTPQEFEIVSLAASGLTNKQIGERLFLSHRTVGGHLHRAFPKLGVATRAALRDALKSMPRNRLPRN